MDRFAVIGLGRFGGRLATNLAAAGHEVLAIDKDREIVEEFSGRVTLAVCLDSTDEESLRAQGIEKFNAAVLGIGADFEALTLSTVILKQIGVPRVIARAWSPTIARILARIGADEVVSPEEESADRWANRLISPRFLNQIEFHEGYSVVEIKAPRKWVGQTLVELNLRAKAGVHVVAIRREGTGDARAGGPRIEMPRPDEPLRSSDILVLMGRDEDLRRLPRDE